eukprot:s12747_g1.t1
MLAERPDLPPCCFNPKPGLPRVALWHTKDHYDLLLPAPPATGLPSAVTDLSEETSVRGIPRAGAGRAPSGAASAASVASSAPTSVKLRAKRGSAALREDPPAASGPVQASLGAPSVASSAPTSLKRARLDLGASASVAPPGPAAVPTLTAGDPASPVPSVAARPPSSSGGPSGIRAYFGSSAVPSGPPTGPALPGDTDSQCLSDVEPPPEAPAEPRRVPYGKSGRFRVARSWPCPLCDYKTPTSVKWSEQKRQHISNYHREHAAALYLRKLPPLTRPGPTDTVRWKCPCCELCLLAGAAASYDQAYAVRLRHWEKAPGPTDTVRWKCPCCELCLLAGAAASYDQAYAVRLRHWEKAHPSELRERFIVLVPPEVSRSNAARATRAVRAAAQSRRMLDLKAAPGPHTVQHVTLPWYAKPGKQARRTCNRALCTCCGQLEDSLKKLNRLPCEPLTATRGPGRRGLRARLAALRDKPDLAEDLHRGLDVVFGVWERLDQAAVSPDPTREHCWDLLAWPDLGMRYICTVCGAVLALVARLGIVTLCLQETRVHPDSWDAVRRAFGHQGYVVHFGEALPGPSAVGGLLVATRLPACPFPLPDSPLLRGRAMALRVAPPQGRPFVLANFHGQLDSYNAGHAASLLLDALGSSGDPWILAGGRPFVLANFHGQLDSYNAGHAASLLLDALGSSGDPWILAGDHNRLQEQWPYSAAFASGLARAWDEFFLSQPHCGTRRNPAGHYTCRTIHFILSHPSLAPLSREQVPGPGDHDVVAYSLPGFGPLPHTACWRRSREQVPGPGDHDVVAYSLPGFGPLPHTACWRRCAPLTPSPDPVFSLPAAFDDAVSGEDLDLAWSLLSCAAEAALGRLCLRDPMGSSRAPRCQSLLERKLRRLARRTAALADCSNHERPGLLSNIASLTADLPPSVAAALPLGP